MKIEYRNDLEVKTIGEDDSVKAGIDESSLPFLFELMSNSLYSNPIGSIVREITSNCLDSHKEAGIDDPIMIDFEYDVEDNTWYIVFTDYGTGMSPMLIMKVYMNYFSSTKRGSNEAIGGFGLGSKTPLSYQDMFYITTVYNNYEYEYIYHKGEVSPELESIHGFCKIEGELWKEVEDISDDGEIITNTIKENKVLKLPIGKKTDKRNGTKIKIEIKSGDLGKFTEELRTQLCYFDDVYFGITTDVVNDFNIYDFKTCKFKNIFQYDTEMHILLDKVAYPIDYKQLDMKPVNIPVGVKFEIGELPVTPNRESIRYTDETKELIKNRINNCIRELVDLFARTSVTRIDNIFEFADLKGKRPHIKLGENDKLYIPVAYGVQDKYVFKDLPEITKIPSNPFFMYSNIGIIHKDEIAYDHSSNIKTKYNNYSRLYITRFNRSNKYKNLFISGRGSSSANTDYRQFPLIKRDTSRGKLDVYAEQLGLLKYDETGKKIRTLGCAKIVYKFIKYMDELVEAKSVNYDNIEISDTWIDNYKKSKKESSPAYLRKINKSIIYKNEYGKREEKKVSELQKADLVIYKILNDDTTSLLDIKTFIESRPSLRRMCNDRNKRLKDGTIKYYPPRIIFIEIAKTNFKFIKPLFNKIKQTKIHEVKMFRNLFRDAKAAKLIYDSDYTDHRYDTSKVSKYYSKLLEELYDFRIRHYHSSISENYNDILKVCEHYNLRNDVIEDKFLEFEKFWKQVNFVQYIDTRIGIKYMAKLLKDLKVTKLKEKYYSTKLNKNGSN